MLGNLSSCYEKYSTLYSLFTYRGMNKPANNYIQSEHYISLGGLIG